MMAPVFEHVSVWETISRRRNITDVHSAARWLLERWPSSVNKPRSFAKAVRLCLAAVDGTVEVDQAREAFVMAADDAGILDRA